MTEPDQPATGGVLSGLPSTRPQRRSPKRSPAPTAAPAATTRRRPAAAATTRRAPAAAAAPTPSRSAAAGAASDATTRRSPKRSSAPTVAAAPTRRGRNGARPTSQAETPPSAAVATPDRRAPLASQGFNAARGTVDPPSRTALLGSVVSGAGEIAEIGLTAGRHVLRSIYGRLPRP